jgi:rhodanese-related sulfurtransferase
MRMFSSPFRSLLRGVPKSSISARSVHKISCAEASRLVKDDHAYLDVRTEDEFAAGHVEGATNVPVWVKGAEGFQPNGAFVNRVEELFPDKSAKICVGCLSGKRSEAASSALEAAGYTSLKDMASGFNGWCQEGLPTTASS